MKRYVTLFALTAITLSATFFVSQVVKAEPVAPMTESHIARIRENCVEAQRSLTQLHASDGLLRVNRGQVYESISTKLMAPLNSRIALNKLDGADLVSTTVAYEKQLDSFRSHYQQYEQTLSRVLNMKCTDQPVAFYDTVQSAREERAIVHADVVGLQKITATYKANFEAFAARRTKADQ